MVPETWSAADRIFFYFGPFFVFCPRHNKEIQNFGFTFYKNKNFTFAYKA